jgi:hypothetical protein
MFRIATPSEVRPRVVAVQQKPAGEIVRIGQLLMAMDARGTDWPRRRDERAPIPGVVVAPSPNARRPAL